MYVKTSDTTTSADRELERRVENYLWGRHVPGLRRLIVSASNGTVTLQGRVRTYYEKQLGGHCCRRVAGVERLVDRVDVVELPTDQSAIAGRDDIAALTNRSRRKGQP